MPFRLIVVLCVFSSLLPAQPPRSNDPSVIIELVAEHPQVVTPTGIAVDSRGRVFVAESHTHFRPDDYDGPKADRILMFSDANGDGTVDSPTVFHEGYTHIMDLEFDHRDQLYVATRMDIHRMTDSSGDGRADTIVPVVKMETTGTYPHNGLSGLCFNADGTLNFGLGENLGHNYTLVGTDQVRISGGGEGGSTYHVKPDGTALRRVTTGWWNPYGMCVDYAGRIFGTDNDPGASPPCRLIQVHEQADYGYEYRYGRTGLNPLISWTGQLPGNIPMIAGTGEAPCDIISSHKTSLPAHLDRSLLVASWADHRIERYEISQPEDQGQVAASRSVLIVGGNDFRPVGLDCAPNGDLYVTDWVSSSYQLHGQGRLWRIRPVRPVKKEPPVREELHGLAAQAALVRKLTLSESTQRIVAAVNSRDPLLRHNGLQILASTAGIADKTVPEVSAADHLLAIKRSGERQRIGASERLREVFETGDTESWAVATKWIADDMLTQHLPVLEAQFQRSDLTVEQFLMLSVAVDRLKGNRITDIPNEKNLSAVVGDPKRSAAIRTACLRLLPLNSSQPADDVLIQLSDHAAEGLRLEAIRKLAGRASARTLEQLTRIQLNPDRSITERIEAVDAIAVRRTKTTQHLVETASGKDAKIAAAALRGLTGAELSPEQHAQLARIQQTSLTRRVLHSEEFAKQNERTVEEWLELLSDADGNAANGERLFFHSVVATCGRCHQHSGRGTAVGPSLSLIGRRLSPDRKKAQQWLLETILDPDRDMAPQYTPWNIVTKDGRQLIGLPRRKGGNSEAYLGVNGQEFSVKKNDIEFHQESRTSIMPKGLLQNLTTQEVRDLFAFLLASGTSLQ